MGVCSGDSASSCSCKRHRDRNIIELVMGMFCHNNWYLGKSTDLGIELLCGDDHADTFFKRNSILPYGKRSEANKKCSSNGRHTSYSWPSIFLLFRLCSSGIFEQKSPWLECCTDSFSSYPETTNLTLEEIDFLFTKEGSTGLQKFGRRSQPVQESLKPVEEIEQDVEKHASVSGATDHVERQHKKSSQE